MECFVVVVFLCYDNVLQVRKAFKIKCLGELNIKGFYFNFLMTSEHQSTFLYAFQSFEDCDKEW